MSFYFGTLTPRSRGEVGITSAIWPVSAEAFWAGSYLVYSVMLTKEDDGHVSQRHTQHGQNMTPVDDEKDERIDGAAGAAARASSSKE